MKLTQFTELVNKTPIYINADQVVAIAPIQQGTRIYVTTPRAGGNNENNCSFFNVSEEPKAVLGRLTIG